MRKAKERFRDDTGGLSWPSKMPGPAWDIPAAACITGSLLRTNPRSVCARCYARKGRYVFGNVRAANERRLAAWADTPDIWRDAMVAELQQTKPPHFRWFSSGDVQSEAMLHSILDIAEACPDTRFWLPTKEWRMVQAVLAERPLPANLAIRLSLPLVYETEREATHAAHIPTLAKLVDLGCTIAATVRRSPYSCPASRQNGHCGDCRSCWDRSKRLTTFPLH